MNPNGEPITGHSVAICASSTNLHHESSARNRLPVEAITMNTDEGWIKLHRKLIRSICWTYSLPMRSVWLTILLRANHAPAWWKGVKIETGQFTTSRDHLARESKVTVSQLRTCWRLLSEWQQIKVENLAKRMTRITVLNWSTYQETQPRESPTDSQPIANQSPTDSHKQECKKEKNKEKDKTILSGKPDIDLAFLECWNLYPDKSGRIKALEAWKKHKPDPEAVKAGIVRYVAYVEAKRKGGFADLKYQNGATWFRNREWESEWTVPASGRYESRFK